MEYDHDRQKRTATGRLRKVIAQPQSPHHLRADSTGRSAVRMFKKTAPSEGHAWRVSKLRATMPARSRNACSGVREALTVHTTRAALALVALVGAPATAAAVYTFDLPRSDDATAVRASMECLDDNGCGLGLSCSEPDAEGSIDATDLDSWSEVEFGGQLWTPWRADASLACAATVEGRANVSVNREHRVADESGELAAASRETYVVRRNGSVIGQFGGAELEAEYPFDIAPGWGDCRPARNGSPCPDSRHVRRTCRDSVGYAVIRGSHGVPPNLPTFEVATTVAEGQSLAVSSWLYDVAGQSATGQTTAWFASHGLVEAALDGSDEAIYRAPLIDGDLRVVVTATVSYGDSPRYCATTSVEFTVADNE